MSWNNDGLRAQIHNEHSSLVNKSLVEMSCLVRSVERIWCTPDAETARTELATTVSVLLGNYSRLARGRSANWVPIRDARVHMFIRIKRYTRAYTNMAAMRRKSEVENQLKHSVGQREIFRTYCKIKQQGRPRRTHWTHVRIQKKFLTKFLWSQLAQPLF